jgi:RNA polymerase sigma-70 factor (ECF subfamily)
LEDERALIERARGGDETALKHLVETYGPRILRFGQKLCRDEEQAREITQQTWLSVADKIGRFRGDSQFSTWLFAIARSHCIKNKTRGAAALPVAPLDESSSAALSPEAPPDEQLARLELEAALDAAIAALEPAQREVLLLRDVEGLSAPEVARVLEVSVDAVKSRLHRARKALRERLSPLLEPNAPGPSCPDVVDLLSRYQEGDVTADACRIMEQHVASCEACAGRCQSLRRVLAVCSSTPTPELPPELRDAVLQQIRRSLRRQTS